MFLGALYALVGLIRFGSGQSSHEYVIFGIGSGKSEECVRLNTIVTNDDGDVIDISQVGSEVVWNTMFIFPIPVLVIFTLIGSLLTWLINYQKNKHDLIQARVKREWEVQDKSNSEHIERERSEFIAYNKILKCAGESLVVVKSRSMDHLGFDIKVYQASVRPLIYENLHLLDKGVI
ncbi:hypothetical protein [Brevibacillus reuszeri]|uniref:hypothetical protein n=1 Tax=Brevibacillus reuszeri TaxID=54915 RepID=UPI003D1E7DAC